MVFNLGRKKVFIQSHWRRNVVLHKTFRRKLCILTVLLRAITDVLCIYSGNLHPNGEDDGFVLVNTKIFAKINKGKCFPQKQEEITSHGFICTSAGTTGDTTTTFQRNGHFSVPEQAAPASSACPAAQTPHALPQAHRRADHGPGSRPPAHLSSASEALLFLNGFLSRIRGRVLAEYRSR